MLTRDRVAHAAAALLGELTSRSLLPAAIITIVKLQAINIIMVSNHCCKCLHRLSHVPQPTLTNQSLLASQRYELARTEDWVEEEEEEVEREGCLVLSEQML